MPIVFGNKVLNLVNYIIDYRKSYLKKTRN
jgi:hypothetical protein